MAQLEEAQRALDEETTQEAAAANEAAALQGAQAQIVDDLHAAGPDGAPGFRIEARGLAVTIITAPVTFDPASAPLTPPGPPLPGPLPPPHPPPPPPPPIPAPPPPPTPTPPRPQP